MFTPQKTIKSIAILLFVGFWLTGCAPEKEPAKPVVPITPTVSTAFNYVPAAERLPDHISVINIFNDEDIEALRRLGLLSFADDSKQIRQELLNSINPEEELAKITQALILNQPVAEVNNSAPLIAGEFGTSPAVAPIISADSTPRSLAPPPAETLEPTPAISAVPIISSETTKEVVPPTPTPDVICGANHYHDIGPASKMEQMPIDFEEFGTWMRSENTYGAFLQTNLLSKSGANAAWMCYFFHSPEDETAVFTQIHPIPGQPNTVRLWVYGNRSGHFLSIWILDREGETWLIPLGPILFDGWRELEATFTGPDAEQSFYISGPSNNVIDFPISFRGLSINDGSNEVINYGSLVIDKIEFVSE
jgi:hypothetical protein